MPEGFNFKGIRALLGKFAEPIMIKPKKANGFIMTFKMILGAGLFGGVVTW
ncbi:MULTISPECIES: hypothetical protein [Acidiplasma]|jgi:hypothetical protein|uniref:hypothetical protein n=1 Tax=Acidiplasma TaxID=507753 RepID=UPI000AF18763|nr:MULTISPECIES: hypothetical protein [Acidiplasma]WMT54313.1 MAG: hypothetical protein RE470_05195 [Acidiplasma sp.]